MLFHDAATAPLAGPVVDVITVAKKDLQADEVLDGIGGFHCYGMTENYDMSSTENLLPMSLAQGCRLKRAIKKDTVLHYDDVVVPEGRLVDQLRSEQDTFFNQKD